MSHNVVEMAEMAADQRRDALRVQRASASQRLRDRLLVRQGLLTQPPRASNSTKVTTQQQGKRQRTGQTNTPEQQAAAHEEALTTSHRVQVEARRASKLHAERTSQRKSMSDRRLAARLQARNKVKSSRCLEKCPAFSTLDQGSVAQIVDAMEYSTVGAGETLCREGAVADKMFVVVSGTCDVCIGGSQVASLRELDVLGESALFPDATGKSVRSATVRCTTPSTLLVLRKAELDTLIQSGVLPQECVSALAAVAERRRQENEALCRQAKQAHALRRSEVFAGLSAEAQDRVVEAMTYAVFEAGSVVCRQGETAARMFLLMSGACTVSMCGGGGGSGGDAAAEGGKRVVGRLGPFDMFGESALMSGKKPPVRGATVTADVDSEVLVLSRAAVPALVRAGHLDREWGARMKKVHRARKKENASKMHPPVAVA